MKILKFEENPKPGAMYGLVSIEFQTTWGMMRIHNIAVFEKNTQRWCNLPQRPTGTKNEKGYNNYTPLIEFSDSHEKDAFHKQFFQILDKFITETSGPSVHSEPKNIPEWKQPRQEVPF